MGTGSSQPRLPARIPSFILALLLLLPHPTQLNFSSTSRPLLMAWGQCCLSTPSGERRALARPRSSAVERAAWLREGGVDTRSALPRGLAPLKLAATLLVPLPVDSVRPSYPAPAPPPSPLPPHPQGPGLLCAHPPVPYGAGGPGAAGRPQVRACGLCNQGCGVDYDPVAPGCHKAFKGKPVALARPAFRGSGAPFPRCR